MAKRSNIVERVDTDLEIDEHLPMQERGWKVQAIGLYLIFALVLTAAAGLYGDGVLSKVTLQQNETTVTFDRFYRFEAQMAVSVSSDHKAGDDLVISLPVRYLKEFKIESILPEPDENVFNSSHIEFRFRGTGPTNVTFYLVPRKVGSIDGAIQVNGNQFALHHFIYP
jgi:hypothetical protein